MQSRTALGGGRAGPGLAGPGQPDRREPGTSVGNRFPFALAGTVHWVVSLRARIVNDGLMPHLKLDRMSADYALLLAKRRADKRVPFSPSWDAAMGVVEDLERESFRLDEVLRMTTRRLVG